MTPHNARVSAEVTELLALLNTGDAWQSLLQPDGMYRVSFWPHPSSGAPRVAVRPTFDEAVREAVG